LQKNYGVTFPMAAKVSVKGSDTAPIFKFLLIKTKWCKKHNYSLEFHQISIE
jgi:glutathione peroxidase-family protein